MARFRVEWSDGEYGERGTLIDSVTGREWSDGGEPEDQSFHRDWSWVPALLNEMADALAAAEARAQAAERQRNDAEARAYGYVQRAEAAEAEVERLRKCALNERHPDCRCHWEEGDSECPVHDAPAAGAAPAHDARPLRSIVDASEPNADGSFWAYLICGHKVPARERKVSYRCNECPAERP
jgi:hypothetical protein